MTAQRASKRSSRLDRIKQTLSEPVGISSLVFFRIVFGIIMLLHVVHEFQSGNVEHVWVLPKVHFTYSGFAWLPHLPGQGYYVLFGVLFVCSALITVGLYFRSAIVLFFVTWSYVFLSAASAYQNHFYLLCLISGMLMCMPAHRSFSLDVYFNRVKRSETAPYWTILLLRLQFAFVYFFGGIAKLNADWLAGHPIDLWLARRSDYFLIGPYTSDVWLIYFIAWGGLALDLLAAPFLFWKRTRLAAYLVTLSFHIVNNRLFSIGIFPWFMIFGTLIFFEPDWPRKYMRKSNISLGATGSPTIGKFGLAAMGAYVLFQLFLPMRPHLYPGNTSWTEEGHFFSWRMMLQDKRIASQSIQLVDPQTNKSSAIVLKDYFEYWQAENMLQTPEFIRQFAEYLVEQEQSHDNTAMIVRADVRISLNGREPQQIIDPRVNLAKVRSELGAAKWILPLTTPLSN